MRNKIIESDLKYITNGDLPWEYLIDKTILITGASGFIASYLVDTFLYLNEIKNFNIKIIGLVRNIKKASLRFSYAINTKKLIFIEQDVCDDIVLEEKLDFIIHAASNATPKVFKKDPVGTILPNIQGTKNLLTLATKNKVDGFLFFSTSGVHGFVKDSDYPIKEDCIGSLNQMDLSSCYLQSKRMGENMCVAWMHQYGVPVKIIRPTTTYGPGIHLDDGRSYSDFISCLVNNKDIILYSDGRAKRNFCYIADAVLGFFTVMLKGKNGEAYNIATDHEISLNNLADYLVTDVFPEKDLKVIMKKDPAKDFLRVNFNRTAVDISKAKLLGWKLNFSIREGFKRAIQSFESN